MDFEESRVIDSNGEKYKVGTDDYGWFSIVIGDMHPDPDTGEMEFYRNRDYPVISFTAKGVDELDAAIEEFRS